MRRLVFLIAILLPCAVAIAADTKAPKTDGQRPSRLLIRSGTLVSTTGAPIQLHAFEADIATGVDEKSSQHLGNKIVLIRTGSAFLSNDALGRLLNAKLKGHHLENIKVTNDKGKLKITGQAKKAVSVPFTIEGPVSLSDQGFIRLEMAKVRVGHLPKGIADLLGLDPEKMAGDGSVKGVTMDKNAIAFDPDLLWGLPVHGQVGRLVVEPNGLLLVFGARRERNRTGRLQARNTAPQGKH